jgi:hypothetical protein
MYVTENKPNIDKYMECRKKANKIICSKKKSLSKQGNRKYGFLSNQNDSRKFYQAAKKLNKGFQPRMNICMDKNGNVIGYKSEIMDRWVEYFEKTLNRRDEQKTEKIQYITVETEIESPSLLEVKMAIGKKKKIEQLVRIS